MQTYGFCVGALSTSPPTNFLFPVYDGNKNVLQPGSIETYRDTKSRHNGVFRRSRLYPESVSSQNGRIRYILEGGYYATSVISTDTQIAYCGKKDNYVFTCYLWKKSREGGIAVAEYDVVPKSGSGVKYCSSRARYGTIAKLYSSYAFDYSSLDRIMKDSLGAAIADTTKRTFGAWTDVAVYASGDLKTVFSDVQSPYYTKMEEEFTHYALFSSFWDHRFNAAAQTAYVNAAANLPQVASNGIANLLELVGAFAALLRRDYEHALYNVKDAWLAYRYSYTTTMLDVREYSSYVKRIRDLGSRSRVIKTHGYFTDGGFSFHVVLKLRSADLLPDSLSERLDQFGLALDAVNAWDMIPYSFIVDWFLPISDALSLWESHYESTDLPVLEAWVSVTSPGGECYLRGPTTWRNAPPVLECHESSDKTMLMRIADAIALLK